jgi:putative ABC transport system permease protein
MFSHIFKLIWKKKSSNFLLTLEIFFSFLVLFAVYSFATYFYQNYKDASGLETENRWVIFLEFNKDTTATIDLVKQKLKTYPEVESFSFSANNVPFSFSSSNSELHCNNRTAMSEIMNVEPNYYETMGMTLSEGRWFTAADTVGDKFHPIVITRSLKEALFGEEDAVGKSWSEKDDEGNISQTYKVMGIVEYFKHKHDFQERTNTFFHPFSPHRSRNAVLLKMRPGTDAELEAK